MSQVNEARERVIALSSSMSGMNSFYMPCKPRGGSQRYSLCQRVVMAIKDKRIGDSFLDCQECVNSGTCIAVKMMIAERKANQCLFYTTDRGYQVLMDAKRKASRAGVPAYMIPDDTDEAEGAEESTTEPEPSVSAKPDTKPKRVKAKPKPKPKPKTAKDSLNNMNANIFSSVIDDLQGE